MIETSVRILGLFMVNRNFSQNMRVIHGKGLPVSCTV